MKNKINRNRAIHLLLLTAVGCIGVLIINYYQTVWGNRKYLFPSTVKAEKTASFPFPDSLNLQASQLHVTTEGHFPEEGNYCLTCHNGIEPTRPHASEMMQQIYALGKKGGDPNGCIVCHGGSPQETQQKEKAHHGAPAVNKQTYFTPVPGALQVNENTCGLCHADHRYNVQRSLMNTDAGKMKTILWSWGIGTENHHHLYGDHSIDDPDGNVPRFGSDTYKRYMQEMAQHYPGQYPGNLQKIPSVSLDSLKQKPQLAAYTYLRNCNACHLSNKGMQDRGHFRGMGCAACHTLYSNEGYYEGNDPSISKTEAGHVLVHSMQGSRKSQIRLHGKTFSGIQVSTCATCHSAGRRIGHAYQGLMALGHSDNRGPFDQNAQPQPANAGYVFKYIRNDVHHRVNRNGKQISGLLCQDCHVTNSMHGNGNIGSTTLATVEVECADCHGTPENYAWELPVGYGDEFGKTLNKKVPRGLGSEPMKVTRSFATVYSPQEGYLLSSRGNAFGNVIKEGDKVVVHSENGNDFEVPLLKDICKNDSWKNPVKAKTAMVAVGKHLESLECYACHATWAPQYYGYKYVLDYTRPSIDWLDSPEKILNDGTTADYHQQYVMQPGAPTLGDYSHVRWENPPLGINGEGRVAPLVGVIQTIATVVGSDSQTIAYNRIAKTAQGMDAMELAPLNPHTTSLESRDCQDCHGNLQAMGYGTDGGVYDAQPGISRYADVVTAEGENISRYSRQQIAAINQLHGDLMQIVNLQGKQVQTVDSHWPTSMPLTSDQRDKLSRGSTCMACHQDIPKGSLPIAMLGKVAQVANLSFAPEDSHSDLLRENNILIAWIKIAGILGGIILIPLVIIYWINRRKIHDKIRSWRRRK